MKTRTRHTTSGVLAAAALLTGCTGQLPGSFRYTQKVESFSSSQDVNTSIDLLWVIDNSASMDVNQKKLRDGFAAFARSYLKPNWDIRIAVITTDTYLAHPAFQSHLSNVIPGTVNYYSNYLASRTSAFINPSSNPTLFNNSTKRFTNGVRYGELAPSWGLNWARLLPGNHDGPMATLCSEILPYFLRGTSLCSSRDQMSPALAASLGTSACTNPDAASGASSVTGCVNTTQNDVIHSGKPILTTQPPAGIAGNDAWIDQLVSNFLINASVGSSGQGSERGMGSLLQLLSDNETGSGAFFRKNSLRGIVFVSDEEDQTMDLAQAQANLSPQTYYQCDYARLAELNPGDARVGQQCSNTGFRCPTKTIDGFSYRVSYCPTTSAPLLAVSSVKSSLDSFFTGLDQAPAGSNPNYFVVAIVPTTAAAVQTLQGSREIEDAGVGVVKGWAVDRGDRYIELTQLVQSGSMAMNIADADYSPILDTIGRTIVSKKATFNLQYAPSALDELIVWIESSSGTRTRLTLSQFAIDGTTLQITDHELVLSLQAGDKIVIDYQPRSI